MTTNQGPEYFASEKKYLAAQTIEEKIFYLEEMIRNFKKHKGSENMLAELKIRRKKLKAKLEKNKKQAKKGFQISLKKEGAATITLVGTTNTGKSTLLNKLTGAKVKIDSYPYTTKKPEIGILDYHGIKLQIVEIPSVFENFEDSDNGPTFLSIIKQSDLIILFFNSPQEKKLLDKELAEINIPVLIYNNQENIEDEIWKRLNLIKVQTKMPRKKPSYPPIALKKDSTIKDLAEHVHKDFLKNFKYARVWGKSVIYDSQRCGINHLLMDNDIVELHLK